MHAKVTAISQMRSTGASALGPALAGFLIQHHLQARGTIAALWAVTVLLAFTALLRLLRPRPGENLPVRVRQG